MPFRFLSFFRAFCRVHRLCRSPWSTCAYLSCIPFIPASSYLSLESFLCRSAPLDADAHIAFPFTFVRIVFASFAITTYSFPRTRSLVLRRHAFSQAEKAQRSLVARRSSTGRDPTCDGSASDALLPLVRAGTQRVRSSEDVDGSGVPKRAVGQDLQNTPTDLPCNSGYPTFYDLLRAGVYHPLP